MAAKGKEGASSKDIEEGGGRGKKAQGRAGSGFGGRRGWESLQDLYARWSYGVMTS